MKNSTQKGMLLMAACAVAFGMVISSAGLSVKAASSCTGVQEKASVKKSGKKEGWYHSGNKWYYRDSKGKLLTGFQHIGDDHGGAHYCFDKDGAMLTGWVKTNGTGGFGWYYFDSTGMMKTGWLKQGDAMYYLNSKGLMHKG